MKEYIIADHPNEKNKLISMIKIVCEYKCDVVVMISDSEENDKVNITTKEVNICCFCKVLLN